MQKQHILQIIYTLCCIAYTVWYYTVGVKLLHKKVSICCIHSGKIYTGQKKFTQAPPVVPVTNMRYANTQLFLQLRLHQLTAFYGPGAFDDPNRGDHAPKVQNELIRNLLPIMQCIGYV